MAQRPRFLKLGRNQRRVNYNDLNVINRRRARNIAQVYLQNMGDNDPMDEGDRPDPLRNMPRAQRGGGGPAVIGPYPPFPAGILAPGVVPGYLAPAEGPIQQLAKRNGIRDMTIGRNRRRKRFSGFSRRSFKFLRWLYHNRKKKRFTAAQQQNALARRQVFFRAWEIARGQGRQYLTGQDVRAAQGGYSARAPGAFSQRNSFV